MTTFDVTDLREQNAKLHGLKDLDKIFTFYYDETNNVRKFYLNENGFNSSYESNFILGGVLHEGENYSGGINNLMEGLRLQATSKKLKLKHIAKGDFANCLKSKKLNYFFKWLLESHLYVHYTSLNILYFSLVDIVDSAMANFERLKEIDISYINLIKNDLYKVAKIEKKNTFSMFYNFEYPNIKKNNIVGFINGLIDIISPYENMPEFHFGITSSRQLLENSIKSQELVFLMDEDDFVLQKDFSQFYTEPIYLFKNSKHIFDREDNIEEIINKYQIVENGVIIDSYDFVNSIDNEFIQISDVFVGILGKFTTFVNTNSIVSLEDKISKMNSLQIDNLNLFHKITDKSHIKNKAFLNAIESYEEREKYGYIANYFS